MIDNCTEFEEKIARVLQAVCERVSLQIKGFDVGNRKRKFLVKAVPEVSLFPKYQDFNVVHNYLATGIPHIQARIRKRGQDSEFYSEIIIIKILIKSFKNRKTKATFFKNKIFHFLII